jgi:hypothetical protein
VELVAKRVGHAVVDGTVEWLVPAQAGRVLLVRDAAHLRAYELERLLSGDNGPLATFVGGWWREHGSYWAVAPDLRTVVVCQADGVVALDPSGARRWRFAHAPWWKDSARGGVCVSADGLHCWAVVPVGDEHGTERWVVLRVSDGTPVATAGLSSRGK